MQCAAVVDELRTAGLRYAKVFTGLDKSHAPARAQYRKVGFSRSLAFHRCYRSLSGATDGQAPGENVGTPDVTVRVARPD